MRILKAVIIGMAVLIVLGMGLLVYGLTQRSVNGNVADDRPAERSILPAFGDTTLPFEDGCDIADIAIEDGRLYIRSQWRLRQGLRPRCRNRYTYRHRQSGTLIILPPSLLRRIVDLAEAAYPEECCGLLIGRFRAPDRIAVSHIAESPNAPASGAPLTNVQLKVRCDQYTT